MQTIEISDEIFEKLTTISKELNNQDHLGTAMPYLFQIKDYKQINATDGCEDGFGLLDVENDNNELNIESVENIIEYLKDYEMYDDLKEDIDEIIENNKQYTNCSFNIDEIIDLLIDKCNMVKYFYQEIATYSNGFFTRKEAENFLKSNHYHFTEKAHVYLNYLSRNEEMKSIMTFLCELSGGKLHL